MLEHLSLQNFKSFKDADFDIGRLTLIVGTNASGKSNIRDALRVLHGVGLGYPLAEILGEKYGPGGILTWRGIRGGAREAARFGHSRFMLGCTILVAEQPLLYRIAIDLSDSTGPQVAEESLWHAKSEAFIWDTNPTDDPVEQHNEHALRVRFPRGGRHKAHGPVAPFSPNRPLVVQIAGGTPPPAAKKASEDVLDALRGIRFLDLDPDAMRVPSQPGQVILGDRGENLSSVLQAICNDKQRRVTLLEWLRALTPMDAIDFEFIPDFSGRVLLHLVESSGAKVSAVSASDGTLRFLALIAALLSPDSGRIYFFEEFDNGIHPTRLHLLLQLVQQVCKQEAVQVIGTTHNPAMLAFLEEDALNHALLVYRHDSSGSRVRKIADLPNLREILKTQDLGRLHATGWLENAAIFSEADDDDADTEGVG
ncbi:MAG: AAA family ATPase [Nannocystis sp.]|nr:AAA family ATPase [Nannocystis sp.]